MTADDARQHYKIVMSALVQERQKRDLLLKEPRRTKAVLEMDRAIASLKQIGEALNDAKAAGVLTSQPMLVSEEVE